MKSKREGMKSTGCLWLAAVAAVAVLLIQSQPAGAGAEYDSSINYYKNGGYAWKNASDESDTRVSYNSFAGGVGTGWSISNGEAMAFAGGRADAGSLSLGAYAQVVSTPSNSHLSDARMSVAASNRLTIMPGSSGLQIGDVTLLTLKLRLDGHMHSEAISYPGSSWSHAEMSAGLSVYDYAIQIDTGEGYWTPSLASFGASCELESYHVYKPYWGYGYSSLKDKSWDYYTNTGDEDEYDNYTEVEETDESFHFQDGLPFDTGLLTLTFEAIVGHTLDFEADLYLYVDAANDAEISANFDNTFAFDVTPDDSVSGLDLSWQTVPEPATLLLLALGALALRKKQ